MIHVFLPTTPGRKARREKTIASLAENDYPHIVHVYQNLDGGVVKAFHVMLEDIKDDALVTIINDDMTASPDYLRTLAEAYHAAFPNREGLAQGHDSFHHGLMYGDPLAPAWMFKKYWHKGYVHNYSDTEFTAVAKKLGIPAIYVPEAVKEHVHFFRDPSLYDETYRITQSFFKVDEELFTKRREANFEPANY